MRPTCILREGSAELVAWRERQVQPPLVDHPQVRLKGNKAYWRLLEKVDRREADAWTEAGVRCM